MTTISEATPLQLKLVRARAERIARPYRPVPQPVPPRAQWRPPIRHKLSAHDIKLPPVLSVRYIMHAVAEAFDITAADIRGGWSCRATSQSGCAGKCYRRPPRCRPSPVGTVATMPLRCMRAAA